MMPRPPSSSSSSIIAALCSIAMEILAGCSVLVLDEPTTGLDSKNAYDVISVMRKIVDEGRTVICTLHQPSWQALQMVDRLIMLDGGSVVYHGPVMEMPEYFAQQNVVASAYESAIDRYIQAVQDTSAQPSFQERWRLHRERSEGAGSAKQTTTGTTEHVISSVSSCPLPIVTRKRYAIGTLAQTAILMQRNFHDSLW
eukprot:GHVU01170455.1.p1 GENE.GHVU01170455.1~~GHVU01170455.1.p1  ORF type:complete len:198 (+),score=33.01 GHVU01170455.1:713-1306(+)